MPNPYGQAEQFEHRTSRGSRHKTQQCCVAQSAVLISLAYAHAYAQTYVRRYCKKTSEKTRETIIADFLFLGFYFSLTWIKRRTRENTESVCVYVLAFDECVY